MLKRFFIVVIIIILMLLLFWWYKPSASFKKIEDTISHSVVQLSQPSTESLAEKPSNISVPMNVVQKNNQLKNTSQSSIHTPIMPRFNRGTQKKTFMPGREKGHLWFGVGYGQLDVHNPDFKIGSQTESNSTPYQTINNNGWAGLYHMAAGYQFYTRNKLVTRLFGARPILFLQMNYYSPSAVEEKTATATGELYKITGGLVTVDGITTQLQNSSLKAKTKSMDFGLYLSGHQQTRWNRFSFNPYIGLIYNYAKDQYDFSSEYADGEDFVTDEENYRLKTQYYGISGGSQFNYQIFKKLTAFFDIQLQLLHALANLNANQTYDGGSPLPVSLSLDKNDNKSVTYRGMLAVGASYDFSNWVDGLALSLMGGVDHYGYAAEIITPHADADPGVHLNDDEKNNLFIMLKLSTPLPFLT